MQYSFLFLLLIVIKVQLFYFKILFPMLIHYFQVLVNANNEAYMDYVCISDAVETGCQNAS